MLISSCTNKEASKTKISNIEADKKIVSSFTKFGKNDYKGVVKDTNALLESQPDNPEAYMTRGNAYLKLKDYNAAKKDFQKASEIFKSQGNTIGNKMALQFISAIQTN
jgi:Tfp pilus assembly protein PilF